MKKVVGFAIQPLRNVSHVLTAGLFFLAGLGLFASAVFAAGGNGGQPGPPQYVEDELLIKFKPGVSENVKRNLHAKHKSLKKKDFLKKRIDHVRTAPGMTVEEAIEFYRAEPDVEYAEPNYLSTPQVFPDDPNFSNSLWNLYNTGQTGGTPGADINAPPAWDLTTGSSDVVVAIIDTGVDYNHEDLAANMWVNAAEYSGLTGVDDDGNGYIDDIYGIDPYSLDSDPMDEYSHGTHVAGTIGAVGNNGLGVTGVNWSVRLLPCRVGSASFSSSAILECMDYTMARKALGENIVAVNASYGGYGFSQAIYDGIDLLLGSGILFIAAAGNDNVDCDLQPFYPASYDLPNIISVTATDEHDGQFYNYGRRSVHVGAPGLGIYSTLPNNGYGWNYGTSMATPHVSGLAALIKSYDPGKDWIAIRNLILSGGDDLPSLDGITLTGKRVSALESLTCTDRPVFSVVDFPTSFEIGGPETLSVLSINCENPVGPVTATTSGSEVIDLLDDGIAPDLVAGDGMFTATWTPAVTPEVLSFSSPTGAEEVVTPPVAVATVVVPFAPKDQYFSRTLEAKDGIPPYHGWTITAGDLPAGLTLDSATGEISGTPTATGRSNFTIQVQDSYNTTSRPKNLFVYVYEANSLHELWSRTFDIGSVDTAKGVAVDEEGNLYLAGFMNNGSNTDCLIVKSDPAGNVLWTQTYDSGYNDYCSDITLDAAGNAHAAGYIHNGLNNDMYTVKYDSEGTMLWTQIYDGGQNDIATGVAVDDDGNVHVVGYARRTTEDYLTIKYDASGNEIWSRFYDADSFDYPVGVGVDAAGNVYIAGRSNNDYFIAKYDSSGTELWNRAYNYWAQDSPQGMTVDRAGNVYVTGYTTYNGMYHPYDYLTVKYDTDGNLVWSDVYDLGFHDYARSVSVDGAGNVYVTGGPYTGSGGTYVPFTLKYDPSGVRAGGRAYDTPGVLVYATTVDSLGTLYVAGRSGDDLLAFRYAPAQPATFYVHTTSDCGGETYKNGPRYAPLGTISGDCAVEDAISWRFQGGPREMLIGYPPGAGYAQDMAILGADQGNDLSFLAWDSDGTGYASLVEVDPNLGEVVAVLSTLSTPLSAGTPASITDVSGFSGTVRAGNTVGLMLSMETIGRSVNEILWGRTSGGPGYEQWFTVAETPAPCVPTGLPDDTCDGVDDDCNGQPDDGYVVTPSSCGEGVCASTGQWECQSGSEVDTCVPGPPATEGPLGDPTCSDTLDNDCDGLTDDADTADCGTVLCQDYTDKGSCNEDPNCEWQGSPKNGVCVPSSGGVCTDNDGDGWGDPGDASCPNGAERDCDDTNVDANPGAVEGPEGDPTCFDGFDNDCDLQVDILDPGCQPPVDCGQHPDKDTCNLYPACRWDKKNGVCIDR